MPLNKSNTSRMGIRFVSQPIPQLLKKIYHSWMSDNAQTCVYGCGQRIFQYKEVMSYVSTEGIKWKYIIAFDPGRVASMRD